MKITIHEGLLDERYGEHAKMKINVSWFKIISILKWKSSTKGGGQPLQMGEKGKRMSWFHQMGPLESSKPMHTLLKCMFLHVQMHLSDIIMHMAMENDPKPFPKSP